MSNLNQDNLEFDQTIHKREQLLELMNELTAIDKNVIETLKGLMKDRFNFLIQTFIDKTATQLEELKTAITDNNTANIISITHAIKGSSGSVGASGMHLLSKQYEDCARSGNFDTVDTWPALLDTEYNRYKNEIQNFL